MNAQVPLVPISGADGEFEIVNIAGKSVYRSKGSAGNYAPYMYLQTNTDVVNKTVYVELTFQDIGYGLVTIDYNSATSDYQNIKGKNAFLINSNGEKTMVFELRNASFRNAQNLGADLRIQSDVSIQKHLISATLHYSPTELWSRLTEYYFGSYTGRKYEGTDVIDATTLDRKVICGYQGWFRAPGDPSPDGWVHFFRDQDLNKVTVEMWPEMDEYSNEEKYPVPGWTLKDGKQATLFSSANKKTILRHFQWMQAYGIHGVAVQRFVGQLYPGHTHEVFRIPSYVREAANRTGRTFYIMYDQSGMPADQLVEYISKDWKILVDSMKITRDERYLKHGGMPVVSLFGYWEDRFSPQVAAQIASIFQQPGYEAHLIGSGDRLDVNNTNWNTIYDDFLAYFPWNVGNYTSLNLNTAFVSTHQWMEEKTFLDDHNVMFMPLIFPGFGWDNLMNQPPGSTRFGRRKGQVMWKQISDAVDIGAKSLYVAMFDEIDESTAIFKIANNIPTNHYFTTNEDLPSDFYLSLTGFASSIMEGKQQMPSAMPDFAKWTQPSIPEIKFPQHLDTIYSNEDLKLAWSEAFHTSGIKNYQIKIDGNTLETSDTLHFWSNLGEGWHTVSVRARNTLNNYGGWSEVNRFFKTNKLTSTDNQAFDIQIYPNPVNKMLYINGLDHEDPMNICIKDASGRSLIEIKNTSEIDISALRPGIFFLYLLKANGDILIAKFIKMD